MNTLNNAIKILLIPIILFIIGSCKDDIKEENIFDIPHSQNQPISVANIEPQTGGFGSRIVVTGKNFGNEKDKIKLFFNKKEALVLKVQDNAIYAMVPKQPGELSSIKVQFINSETSEPKEAELSDILFKYNIRATVSTIAGVAGESGVKDGTAIEGKFGRPSKLEVDSLGNNIFVVDDHGGRVRHISVNDNKLTTILGGLQHPWDCSFNQSYTQFYVGERSLASKPLLFVGLSKESNWVDSENYYDQRGANDQYIAGTYNYFGLTSDDKYVYLLASNGVRLVRMNQESRKVELMGENLNIGDWANMAYNSVDKHVYINGETFGRIYRFDPYKNYIGDGKPWLTYKDMEHVAGNGQQSTAIEGNGTFAQFGTLESIAADREGNLYMPDYRNHIIWKMDKDFNCTILAGVPGQKGYKDGKPNESLFNSPYGIAATPDGIVYVADTYNYVIRSIAIQ